MSEVSVKEVINLGRVGNYFLLCDKRPVERPYLLATESGIEKKVFYCLCAFMTEEAAKRFAKRDMENTRLSYGR